jgi:hypothetical protein
MSASGVSVTRVTSPRSPALGDAASGGGTGDAIGEGIGGETGDGGGDAAGGDQGIVVAGSGWGTFGPGVIR